jgi:uncharacterized cupredoxin-like copper-binding protein
VAQTGSASGKPLKTFTVTETDFTLTPSTFRISKPSTYAFHAINKGHVEHSLEVDGRGVQKALPSKLAPGQSGNLTLLLGPGTYEIYCPVDDHRGNGMRGTIDVAGAKSQPTSTTTTTSSAGGGY